jgi:hypothetical protein
MKQLINCDPKPVYEVRFIREKGKATARAVQWSPETSSSCSGEGWGFYRRFNSALGGLFSLAVYLLVWLSQVSCLFCPLLGEGKQS